MSRKPVTCINCGGKMIWAERHRIMEGIAYWRLSCRCGLTAPYIKKNGAFMSRRSSLSAYRKLMRLVEKGREG